MISLMHNCACGPRFFCAICFISPDFALDTQNVSTSQNISSKLMVNTFLNRFVNVDTHILPILKGVHIFNSELTLVHLSAAYLSIIPVLVWLSATLFTIGYSLICFMLHLIVRWHRACKFA